jgi:putative phosphoesterase
MAMTSGRSGDALQERPLVIAALYDVHANLPALNAVLDEVPDEATIVLGGDHVYGPFPAETLERLRALGDRAVWVRGNCDREQAELAGTSASQDVLEWVGRRLRPADVDFLAGLPATVVVDGMLFCHATPQNDVDRFGAETPEEQIAPWFASVPVDVVVCGHTHRQFDRIVAGRRVVNAGSVGMPHEDAHGAYWMLFDGDVAFRRTPYDHAPLLAAADYPRPWWND